ncbi:MAG: ADP-ribosylation factor family protein [Candidatus Heimdallarchaeaceae archaeon]|uniref:ADP-ribosylation factor-like protein n=1 Tax=Candidatus Heimdallarchaeum endolithica TaxID=2876572 RepID=A0A9Y1BQI9_9ARCH|nr:MAG: ADP-ribosylation factor-like protein [Candidatus Heimdallarchaeum endolithica]
MSMIGSFSTWLRSRLKKEHKAKILILGLDAAGKTTLTRYMRFGKFNENMAPTIGQNIESFEFEGWTLTTIDVAGQAHFRFLWEAHYPGTEAVIFVIDSADIERLPEARDVLKTHVMNNPYMESVPILILANKQDLPGAVEAPLLIQMLGLHLDLKDRTFAVFDCSVLHGKGVKEAFIWLINELESKKY